MIQNEGQLKLTETQLARLERALAALKAEVYPKSPERFFLLAEAYVDEIRKLRQEIDDFIGLTLLQQHEALSVPQMVDSTAEAR
jgi:hypothetical protein